MDGNEERPPREKAVQHLEEALEVENTEETNYHLREALQLLNVAADSNEGD